MSLAGAIKDDKGEWMIIAVYTRSSARKKGYSQKLIKQVIEILEEKKVQTVKLMVNTDQLEAVYWVSRIPRLIIAGDERQNDVEGRSPFFYQKPALMPSPNTSPALRRG